MAAARQSPIYPSLSWRTSLSRREPLGARRTALYDALSGPLTATPRRTEGRSQGEINGDRTTDGRARIDYDDKDEKEEDNTTNGDTTERENLKRDTGTRPHSRPTVLVLKSSPRRNRNALSSRRTQKRKYTNAQRQTQKGALAIYTESTRERARAHAASYVTHCTARRLAAERNGIGPNCLGYDAVLPRG